MNWIVLTMSVILILFILARAVFRVVAPFWSRQPVMHPHCLNMWLTAPKVIQTQLPILNQYTDHKVVTSMEASNIADSVKEEMTEFISDYFLRSKGAKYTPQWKHISQGFAGASHESFIAIGRNKDGSLISTISARPVLIRNAGKDPFWSYYVDNLCVKPDVRKQGIAPKTIQTFCHDLRHKTDDSIQTVVFKREGVSMGLVPITIFPVYGFQTGVMDVLPSNLTVIELRSQIELRDAWVHIERFIKRYSTSFTMSMTSVLDSIKNGVVKVYIGKNKTSDVIQAVALIRDAACTYDEGRSIELSALLSNPGCKEVMGFAAAACKKACTAFDATLVIVDGCGEGERFAQTLIKKDRSPVFHSKTSLFFYNYASHPVFPENSVFFI
jgi:hypothetical protein